jgi:hypothetical protein
MRNEKMSIMQHGTKTVKNAILYSLFVLLAFLILGLVMPEFALAEPTGPSLVYLSNSTKAAVSTSRNQDAKGTITVVNLTSNQQSYKWKAYVGNVTGRLVLDDSTGMSIYDWSLAAITGEVYVTRASSVTWANVSCVNQTVIDTEEAFFGIQPASVDSINRTFASTLHRSFLIGGRNISNSTCRSTATYVNDTAQSITESSVFQEILLRDGLSSSMIYTTLIESDQLSYDGTRTYDFQMLVAENESSSVHATYYFYVELG